jgi:hypothetical protein
MVWPMACPLLPTEGAALDDVVVLLEVLLGAA